jgi:hypothetical protein
MSLPPLIRYAQLALGLLLGAAVHAQEVEQQEQVIPITLPELEVLGEIPVDVSALPSRATRVPAPPYIYTVSSSNCGWKYSPGLITTCNHGESLLRVTILEFGYGNIPDVRMSGEQLPSSAEYATTTVCSTVSCLSTPLTSKEWPKIQEFDIKILIDANAKRLFIEVPFYSVQGKKEYTFICRGGDEKYLDEIYQKTDTIYVRPMTCALNDGVESEVTLLSPDNDVSWHSRGSFSHDYADIVGLCGKYPQFGALRHFRLRGFEFTMSFEDIVADSANKVQYFTLHLSLRQNSKIISDKAEPIGILHPQGRLRKCKIRSRKIYVQRL